MNIKHLDHLNMSVKDLPKSIGFYRDLFGFEVVERGVQSTGPWAIIKAGEAMLCLYQDMSSWDADAQALSHFAFRIIDAAPFLERVESQNIAFSYDVQNWRNSTSWYVEDPSGYEIEVVLWNDDKIRFEERAAS